MPFKAVVSSCDGEHFFHIMIMKYSEKYNYYHKIMHNVIFLFYMIYLPPPSPQMRSLKMVVTGMMMMMSGALISSELMEFN